MATFASFYKIIEMTPSKEKTISGSVVTEEYTFPVRFNEVDALGIVWHGHFINYFEVGREAFGWSNGISYLDIQKAGFTTPVIRSVCEHKFPLRYGDTVRVVTTYHPSAAAKLIFSYRLYNQDNVLVCTGETIQVFLNKDGDLQLYYPDFFAAWKNRTLSER